MGGRAGGGGWRRSMGAWSWRTRGALRGIIWRLVGWSGSLCEHNDDRDGGFSHCFLHSPRVGRRGLTCPPAAERTFLAWLRTSLSFASIGVAITQLFRLNTSLNPSSSPSASANPQATLHHVGKPLGATFIGIAIAVLLVGYHRYFESQHWIIRGKFPASRGAVVFVALVAGALMLASLVVVVSVARGDE